MIRCSSFWRRGLLGVRVEFSDLLRLKLSLKTAAACLVADVAARGLGLSRPYWAVISAFIIVQISLADTVRKGLLRVAGTAAGSLFGVFLALVLPGRPYPASAAVFLWCLVLFYLGGGKRYSYAVSMAAVTPFLVILAAAAGLQEAVAAAFDRFATIILGVAVSGLAVARVWPVDEGRELLTACGKMVKGAVALSLTVLGGFSPQGLAPEAARLKKLTRRIEYLLEKADFSRLPPGSRGRIRSLLASLRSLLSYALHLEKVSAKRVAAPADDHFGRGLFRLLEEIGGVPDLEAPAFVAGRREEIRRVSAALEEESISSLSTGGEIGWDLTVRRMFIFYLAETLGEIAETMSRPAGEEPAAGSHPRPASPRRGLDRAAGRAALKKAAAVLLAALAWAIPFHNVQSVISATLIAGQSHQTASYRKAFFRVLGTVLGGAAGYALAAAFGGREAALAVAGAMMILLFAYLGLGEEDWHYIGLTAGICFILVLASGPAEPGVPSVALRRLVGVILGGLTAAVTVKFLFPLDLLRRLEELEDRLRSLHRAGLAALGKGPAGTEEAAGLRREMRSVTIAYGDACRTVVWDRLRYFRRRADFSARAQLGLDIYRAFFPLFSIFRSLFRKGEAVPLGESISTLLKSLAEEAGGARAGNFAAFRDRVTRLLVELDAIESASGPESLLELFFFTRVFLHHLRILIGGLEDFRVKWT